jgi:hypothetical protein
MKRKVNASSAVLQKNDCYYQKNESQSSEHKGFELLGKISYQTA